MDFVNKAIAQLADLFRSMTPGARITAGLLLVVVVISVAYLFQHQTSVGDVFLMNGEPIPPSCLPAMEAAFAKADLKSYSIEGSRIRVPRGQQGAYMGALADAKALPPNFGSSLQRYSSEASPFTSPAVQKERMKMAIQEELSLIIRSMKDIENASVLYDSDVRQSLGGQKTVTASVSVKPAGTDSLDESKVTAIRHLVASAIAGLKPENVTVADLNGGIYHGGDSDSGGLTSENLYRSVKQMHERDLKAKILSALSYISGLTVEPSIELDRERSSHSRQIKHDPKAVTYEIEEKNENRNQDGGGTAGRPGFQPQSNAPTSLAASSTKGSHEEEERSNRKERMLVSGEQIEKETVGLTPKSAKVSVGIPSSYFAKVWRERNPPKDGEPQKEPDQTALDAVKQEVSGDVKKHVATLLPAVTGTADMAEMVTVTTFQDLKPGAIPEPATTQLAMAWLGRNWSTLGLGLLALVSLGMVRSMVRSVPAAEPATLAARVAAPEPTVEEKETAETVAARRLKRISAGGPSLRDELSEIVKEDPDAAANILRAWIGQAG